LIALIDDWTIRPDGIRHYVGPAVLYLFLCTWSILFVEDEAINVLTGGLFTVTVPFKIARSRI